jgi:hypothetical protein
MNEQFDMFTEQSSDRENRLWIRFPSDEPQMGVDVDGERKMATIIDESYGGIGILMEAKDALHLKVDDPLIVYQNDFPTPCRVQWIQWDDETQKVRIGIRWTT